MKKKMWEEGEKIENVNHVVETRRKWKTGLEEASTSETPTPHCVCPQRSESNRITHTSKRRFCFSSKK